MPGIRLSRGGHSCSRAAPLPRQHGCPGKGSFDLLPEAIAGNFTFSLPLRPQVEAPPTPLPAHPSGDEWMCVYAIVGTEAERGAPRPQ